MLLQILPKRHRLLNHLSVQLRGIEQMQIALLPHSETEMSDIESGLLAGDGDDVAVADHLAQLGTPPYPRLGDITELLTRHALLHLADLADIVRMLAQHLITLGMVAHIVDIDGLNGHKRRIRLLDLGHKTSLRVLGDPLREVMDATGVTIDDALPIAHGREGFQIGLPRVLLAVNTLREGGHGLDQCRAIQLSRVHHQALVSLCLKGMRHVWDAKELTGKEQRDVRIGRLAAHLVEQSANGDAVGLMKDRLLSQHLRGDRGRQKKTEEDKRQ